MLENRFKDMPEGIAWKKDSWKVYVNGKVRAFENLSNAEMFFELELNKRETRKELDKRYDYNY